MKTFLAHPALWFLHSSFFILHLSAAAATNDLTSALQKGLFEEEANHNLEAAAQAYQTVSAQFDKDRKLAATAIFRLGEVYRKQGKTNEATAQYERIVREFADQPTLVTLSRQNLSATQPGGKSPITKPSTEAADETTRKLVAEAERDSTEATELIKRIKSLEGDKARMLVQQSLPNAVMDSLMKQLAEAEQKVAALKIDYHPEHPTMRSAVALLKIVQDQCDTQIVSALTTLEFKRDVAEKRLAALRVPPVGQSSAPPAAEPSRTTDEEEKEIRRIQAMIQNSPDLINAPVSEGGVTPLWSAASSGQLRVAKFLLDAGAVVDQRAGGGSPIHRAAAAGHKAMVELLLDHKADANGRDTSGKTPLHSAAENGFQSVVETLLARKADVNAQTKKNQETPLHLAAGKGHSAMVELLVAKGAQLDVKDARGRTALASASYSGHALVVKRLLEARADANIPDSEGRNALSHAAEKGHLEVVRALLEGKADPNIGKLNLPLAMAARGKRQEIAEALLQAGADANLAGKLSSPVGTPNQPSFGSGGPGPFGPYVPLQIAVAQLDAAMVKLLLKFKADANAKDLWSTPPSPLTRWILGDAEILRAFLDAGADANAEAWQEWPLLVQASVDGNATAVELLLAHGAKPNVEGHEGRSSLNYAAEKICLKCVELLLEAKADANAATRDGITALHWALNLGAKEMVEALIAHGADVNRKTQSGETPLHWAMRIGKNGIGSAKMAELLLAKGADPNMRNNDGNTPLDFAKAQSASPRFGGVGAMPLPGVGLPTIPTRALRQPDGTPAENQPVDVAALLRQHGALDDLPDFNSIRFTRQGIAQPQKVFAKGPKLTNQFTLLETVMAFYNQQTVTINSQVVRQPAHQAFLFPDFGRIIIRRPSQKAGGGKDQEIKASLLNRSNLVDCAKDVPVEFGDVIEIPERIHALNEGSTDPVREMEQSFVDTKFRANQSLLLQGRNYPTNEVIRVMKKADEAKATTQRWECLQKSVQLVVAGEPTTFTVDSWKEGFLSQALAKTEARAVLRSSSDLSRVKVTRKAATGKSNALTVDVSNNPQRNDDLWLRDGDVIEVPDKP